jgi:curved DNA-binding protein CbpA/plastocyanin
MGWLIYFGVVLAASLLLGWHLGRFREACSEMTGMMAGMTIGMLGGFALGYGMTAAVGRDLFWGNLVGVLLGAVLGGWYGRAGELMGIMDGAMGGIMGGSMGAMIAAMLYPNWALQWTGVLFGGAYVAGALALTALIESRTPEHAHLHWLLPRLAGARRTRKPLPARSSAAPARRSGVAAATKPKAAQAAAVPAATKPKAATATTPVREPAPAARPIRDYYSLLGVAKDAHLEAIEEAYLDLLATGDPATVEQADRALLILRDPDRRARYDSALEESRKRQSPPPARQSAAESSTTTGDERGDCCPPKKKSTDIWQAASPEATGGATNAAAAQPTPLPARPAAVTRVPAPPPTPKPQTLAAVQAAPAKQTAAAPVPARAANAVQPATAQSRSSASTQKSSKGNKRSKHNKHATQGAQAGKNRAESQGRDQRQTARRGYAQQDDGFARRMVIGTALGAAATLLFFWIGVSVAAGGGSSAQAASDPYSNPPGAIYHAPGAIPSEAQLEGKAVTAALAADGVQTADLVLDERTSSYSPAAIKVKKGVPVRLNLSNTNGGRDCRSVVDITALGARGFIEAGQPSTLDFTPTQAGVYEINCPMRMVNPSYIVVTN